MDALPKDQPNFQVNFQEKQFKTLSKEEKDAIKNRSKAKNTHKSTKVLITAFDNYLAKKDLPNADEINTEDLPNALEDFYPGNSKKNATADGSTEYKNSTMKCIRAGINRYYKAARSLDIISDPRFIQANKIFKGIARAGKDEGCGEIDSCNSIFPEDFDKLSGNFKAKMAGLLNAVVLQEIVIFNVIYYMRHRGCENLQKMTLKTFDLAVDPSGKRYIYQKSTKPTKTTERMT